MGKGRKKGVPNKFTTLKDAFLYAFEEIGSREGLAKWAKKNRRAFYVIITKMLPNKSDVEISGPGASGRIFTDLELAARLSFLIETAIKRKREHDELENKEVKQISETIQKE
jgi:hypothetical protein